MSLGPGPSLDVGMLPRKPLAVYATRDPIPGPERLNAGPEILAAPTSTLSAGPRGRHPLRLPGGPLLDPYIGGRLYPHEIINKLAPLIFPNPKSGGLPPVFFPASF